MSRGRLTLVGGPDLYYCTDYHCAGDCGLPHNSKERIEYAARVLSVFDDIEHSKNREIRDLRSEIERKARNDI